MHVKDEVGGRAVKVDDWEKCGARAIGDEVGGRCVVVAREKDLVACSASLADGCYGSLDCGCPFCNVHVVLEKASVQSKYFMSDTNAGDVQARS